VFVVLAHTGFGPVMLQVGMGLTTSVAQQLLVQPLEPVISTQ
jgi:hypothetical protein